MQWIGADKGKMWVFEKVVNINKLNYDSVED